MSPTRFNCLLALGTMLLLSASARAQLAAASPFLPPAGAGSAAASTSNAPLEFRGVADLIGGREFRVVDPARKAGVWVHLNERDPELGIIVKQHDPENETVLVEQQGRTFTLQLHQSKVASAGAPMMTMNLPNSIPPQPAPGGAVGPQPVTLQQQQLDAVAAAVAQRRALREQAQQQIGQAGTLASPALQMPPAQRTQTTSNASQQNQGGQNNPGAQRAQRNRQPP